MAALDVDHLLALSAAVGERNERRAQATAWTNTEELLAQAIELLSVMRVEALLGKVKPHRLPKPFRVPRPGGEHRDETEVVMSPRDFALMAA